MVLGIEIRELQAIRFYLGSHAMSLSIRQRGGRPTHRSDLPKARRAFLSEGAAALLRLLRAVIERDRLEAERAQAPQLLGIGVEPALGDRDRGRAFLLDLRAPARALLV